MSDIELLERIKNYIIRYCREYKKFPKRNHIIQKMGVTKYQVDNIMKILVHQEFLDKNYNHYAIHENNKHNKKITFKNIIEKKNDLILISIRILMIIIGIGAIILSTYYTSIWLFSFLPVPLAVLLSTIMVAFSVASFEAIIIFKENRQGFMIIVFSVIWLIVVCFSMVSTIAGQYNARMKYEEENFTEKSEEKHQETIYDSYIIEEEEIKDQMEKKNERLKYLNKFIIQFDSEMLLEKENMRMYNKTLDEIHRIENELRILRDELKEKRDRKREFLEQQRESGIMVAAIEEKESISASFYMWLAFVLSLDPTHIEFWLSVFPAVFIDIIAPLAVAVGMFLKRKGKEDE